MNVEYFESTYGDVAFCKVCISAINRILVERGVINEYDIVSKLEEEMFWYISSETEKKV